MGFSDFVPPVASSNGDDGKLCCDDCSTDGGSNLLGTLHPETDVPIVVPDGHESLKSRPLTSPCLFLNRHDFQHFVLESGAQKLVDNFVFL